MDWYNSTLPSRRVALERIEPDGSRDAPRQRRIANVSLSDAAAAVSAARACVLITVVLAAILCFMTLFPVSSEMSFSSWSPAQRFFAAALILFVALAMLFIGVRVNYVPPDPLLT